MKAQYWLGLIIGIPAFGWFTALTDWRVALALLLILYANNLSQWKAASSIALSAQGGKHG